MSVEGDLQHSLRIGDTVLFYVKDAHGYVFSELSSSRHNSVAVTPRGSLREPDLANVHLATFCVVAANKNKAQERLTDLQKRIGKRPSTQERGVLLQAQKDLEAELKDNAAEQERLTGTSLVYGESVQLQHSLTKKYLTVNTTLTSRVENTSLRVELRAENTQGCIFKILPRYKVRSVGDVVRFNDQVKLESVKTEGQFLHCSVKPLGAIGFHVHEHCPELNLSATESALTIIPHYRPVPRQDPKTFRAGQSVRLFHREYECYIAAEGSFAEDPAVVEDVHCRKRKTDHGILKDRSTSSNTYWQFEKESDPRSGEPLSWGERCRIKHMPTRRYLAVTDNGHELKVFLKERSFSGGSLMYTSGQDLETVFSLSPVIQEGDQILVESYARIKHLATRTWLHLDKGKTYVRRAFDPSAPGLKGLEWDSAELFALSASETMNYDDAFTLEQVSEPLLDKFNFVAGIVPVLTTYLNQRGFPHAPPLSSAEAYRVASAVDDLANYISASSNERETKDRQKLLRNLRILELIISILGLFNPDSPDADEQRRVCQACYGVIESYLKGDSRKNENYLARFIDFFQKQVGLNLNAEEVMIEMVEDNTAIVSKMAESEIDFMLQQLVATRDARFLQFLSNLCVCNGRPIPSTQNAILDKLVLTHGKSVFFQLVVGGSDFYPEGEKGVVFFRPPHATSVRDWRPLLDIAGRRGDSEEFEFLDSQLLLFGKMCQGNNERCIQALIERDPHYVSFEQALWCVSCPELHPSIASKYVELIKVMFVDVGENRAVLENLSLSFVYEDVVENPYEDTGEDDVTALTGVVNVHFPDMRGWIKDHLTMVAKQGVVAKNVSDNNLLARVLEVLSLLVKYGYYDDPDDVDDVLHPLVDVINGFSDLPFPQSEQGKEKNSAAYKNLQRQLEDFQANSRFKETEENLAIFEVKERAIEVIDLFFNFRFYVRLQRFIFDFRQLHSGSGRNQPRGILPTTTSQRPPLLLTSLQTAGTELLQNPFLISTARERLKFIFAQSAYFFEAPNYASSGAVPFTEILLDMSRYYSDELVQGSLHLLNRYFSSETALFENAIQTQLLLTEESKKVFNEIGRLLPTLRRLLSVDLGEGGRGEVVDILRTFTNMCKLEEGEGVPHTQNQKILYNFGVLSDILDYVLERGNVIQREMTPAPDDDDDTPHRKISQPAGKASNEIVFVECFRFLKVFARQNLEVQRRLYDRMNDLLDIEVAVPHMASVLTEVFTGGPEICLEVKEEEVERVFQLVSGGVRGQGELLETLQSMAKVEDLDLPIKRNQAFIIKYFSKTREKFCDHLLGEGKTDYRWQLLTESLDDDPDLYLLLVLTDLLASCAEGENLFIESVCQTIYSVEELLLILSHPRLPTERKRPFARFLIWVYLNTEGDKYQSGASNLSSNKSMWAYLEHLGTLLENIGIALRAIPDTEHQWVREGMSTRGRTSSIGKKKGQRVARTKSRNVLYVTTETGELRPGVLLYFLDGALPLLRSFYANFYSPPSAGEDGDKQHTITTTILSNLLQLCDTLMQYFTSSAQVRLYRSTVVTLLHNPPAVIPSQVAPEIVTNFDAKTKHSSGASNPARVQYERYYRDEIALNEAFHKFVSNFQLAYQGPNTAHAQIGAKYPTPYSDFLEEYKVPGDEYLPLGPSFQEHVALFVKRPTGGGGLGALPMAAPFPIRHGRDREETEVLRPETARLITQLEISFRKLKDLDDTERQKQDELDIKTLQILRALVHNEIMAIDPELKESDPAAFRRRCTQRLQPVQNKLQSFGNVVSRVVPLLSHPNDEIVREVLAFLRVMLFSGNRTVQKGFEHLLDTREERLFTTMRSLLQHAAITYRERRALLSQVSSRMATEGALLKSFDSSKVADDQARQRAKESSIAIEMPGAIVEEKNGEYIPLDSLGASRGASFQVASEEGTEAAPLIESSAKKSSKGPRRARISAKPITDLLEMPGSRTLHREGEAVEKYDPYAGIDLETVEVLKFQDSAHIKLALRVLGLMCDGQYRVMQNYLREQKDNIFTINLVGEVALFSQHFYTDINRETMELVHLILQTLIETCVGNYPNQEVVYNRQIIDVLNTILQLDIGDHEKYGYSIEDSVNLKGSAVELVEAMLEETSSHSGELAKEIAGSLDLAAIYDTIGDFYELMNDPEVQRAGFDDEAERGLFRAYHILVHLQDYDISLGQWAEPPEDDEMVKAAFQFCKVRSKSIEINYQNMDGDKILTKVNFQFDPVNELREEVVEKVKWSINRDSAEDKLRDFLEWMYAVKTDTLHHNWLHRHLPTRILISYPGFRYYLLLFLTILLNFFVLITFSVPESRREDEDNENITFSDAAGAIKPYVTFYFRDYLLYILGAFHLIFTIWMIIEYFVVNYPNFIFPLPGFFYRIFRRCGLKEPEKTYSSINIYGLRTLYMIMFLLASIFSIPFYGYFYCLCLLHIIVNNDILQRVLRAVTKNGIALLWVAALGVVVLYIYAVISFAFLHESVNDKGENALYCDSLGQCFISVIRWGLIDNLGLVVPLVPEEFKTSGLRILYDVSFFIIVTTIGLNIVFGIIVDTFSELRDERFRTEQDKKSFCFICSLPNHEFERRAKGFDHHVKQDHNMWTYIYYSIYLDTIDISDHNAIEKFVYEMISDGKIEFFPLLQALCLELEEDETAHQLEALRSMVHTVLERFKEEEHEKTLRDKRQEQEKWEAQVLRGRGSIVPQASLSVDDPSVPR